MMKVWTVWTVVVRCNQLNKSPNIEANNNTGITQCVQPGSVVMFPPETNRLVYFILTGQTCTNAGGETKQSSIPTITLFRNLTICIYLSNKPKYNCRWVYLQRNKL